MRWGRVARLMQSIKEPGWGKNHTKEIESHRSSQNIYASKTVVKHQGYRRRNDLWAKGEGGACPVGT